MREFMKKAASLLCLAVLFLMLGGCQMIRIEEENKTPLAYTVIEDSQIPEEMQELIREKKETEFQIAYQKGTELFLAKGYGRQMSGGYSIQVEEMSESENAVFCRTRLLGPSKEDQGGEPSCPCIVLKIKNTTKPVEFSDAGPGYKFKNRKS